MRQSQLFTKTRRFISREERSINAQLLIRGGFIYKNLSGVYTFLPLGSLVLQKIIQIIREEINRIGGLEMFLSTLQDPEIWKKTKRWSDEQLDVWFRTKLKSGEELGLASTHEEPFSELMSHYISTYEDLPLYVYQFQTKFRNELRPKSGLLRTREFIMKDLYSFTHNQRELDEFYEQVAAAYTRIFDRTGLGHVTYRTFASGGAFSKFSDEFQTICEAGEDIIYFDRKKKVAVNREVYKDEILKELGLERSELEEAKAIEVGNIFKLGTRFSQALGLNYTDEKGQKQPVIMGSYGIGPGRVMGTIVEIHHDKNGIIWPESVAPFAVHLVELPGGNGKKLYDSLRRARIEVLWDDRDVSAGEKFADSDLIGIPWRVVVSKKTGDKVEIKRRNEEKSQLISPSELLKQVGKIK